MSATPGSPTYALGALAVGASQSVTHVIVPKVPAMLFNQAVAQGVGPGPDPSSNYAEVSVTVHQAPTVVSLERLVYHTGPTTLDLRFSAPLDAATAVDVRNYRLCDVHRGGHRAAIRISSAAYDPASRTVVLTPARQLYLFGHYQSVVNGTSPTGESDVYGSLLDGAPARAGPEATMCTCSARSCWWASRTRGPPEPCRDPRGARVSPSHRSIFRN